jgi:hypothetical protein
MSHDGLPVMSMVDGGRSAGRETCNFTVRLTRRQPAAAKRDAAAMTAVLRHKRYRSQVRKFISHAMYRPIAAVLSPSDARYRPMNRL